MSWKKAAISAVNTTSPAEPDTGDPHGMSLRIVRTHIYITVSLQNLTRLCATHRPALTGFCSVGHQLYQ